MTILAAVYNLALILFIALHLAVGGAVRDTPNPIASSFFLSSTLPRVPYIYLPHIP
jgi:hypothetical protein